MKYIKDFACEFKSCFLNQSVLASSEKDIIPLKERP